MDYQERCAKIKEEKVIIDAEREEPWLGAPRVSAKRIGSPLALGNPRYNIDHRLSDGEAR